MTSNSICAASPYFSRYRYTGKERDAESGNDYFGARYYSSSMGRFSSPDPGWMLAADPSNPQTWNMYAYALNNPLTNIDPDGLDCVYFNDAGNGVESVDRNSNSGECGSNGGDWINGRVQSATYFADYTTYANAPGSQQNGTPCYGNCDIANGYFQSSNLPTTNDVPLNPFAQAVFTQVGQQTGPLLNLGNAAAGCVANNTVLAGAAGAATVLGAPVPKSAIFGRTAGMGGNASSFMSGASTLDHLYGSGAKFTGAAAKVSSAVTGTARIAGAVGRVAGPAAVALDTALIAKCISDAGHN
jgi:RHS repeat-associated protein